MTMLTLSDLHSNLKSTPEKLSRQALRPVLSNLYPLGKEHEVFFVKGKPSELLKALRFLLAKVLYEGVTSLKNEEKHLFLLVLVELEEVKDKLFKQKLEFFLTPLRNFFSLLIRWYNTSALQLESQIQMRLDMLSYMLPSKRAFFSLKVLFNVNSLLRRVNLLKKPRVRPKRRIGVGYRDSGTYSDTSWDGSPSWQEVATSNTRLITNRGILEEAVLRWKESKLSRSEFHFFLRQVREEYS